MTHFQIRWHPMVSTWHPHALPSATAPCKANAAAPGLIGLQAQWASTVGQNAVLTTGLFRDVFGVEPQKGSKRIKKDQKGGSGEPENSPEMVFGSWFCRGKWWNMWKIYRKPMRFSFLRNGPWDHFLKDASSLSADCAWSGQYPAVPRASAGINHDTHFSNPSIFLVVEQHFRIFEVRKKMFQLFHINYYWIIRKHALKSCIQWCLSSEPCSKITNRSNGGFLKWGCPVLPNHLFE